MIRQVPPILTNGEAHYMKPGAIAFVPGWIVLFMTILAIAIFHPSFFPKTALDEFYPINATLFLFIIGSLIPVFDDLMAFLFGKPFAHHSLFHSFFGSAITYLLFLILGGVQVAKFALLGNVFHIAFNFYLDYVTLFFPFSYREFGLTDIVKITTYWLKVINYPILFCLFFLSILLRLLHNS